MIFHEVEKTVTPSAGTVAVNSGFVRGRAELFYAKAVTGTTTFDLKIEDKDGRVVRHYREEEGTLRDTVPLPMLGKYTLTIENASADEAIEIYIMLREGK